MAFHDTVERGIDYDLCSYGTSRLPFRGPCRDPGGGYAVALGGSETFGRYVKHPFPDLIEVDIGICLNLGCVIAGPTAFLSDPTVMDLVTGAQVVVLQITGAHNLSNPFFRVHRRRNDRFLHATDALRDLYPELDFTEVHFVRHLLGTLESADATRFAVVRDALRSAWTDSFAELRAAATGRVIPLWIARRTPDAPADRLSDGDPSYVTRAMADRVFGAGHMVEIVRPPVEDDDQEGKVFSRAERAAALQMPGPVAHRLAARALMERIAKADTKKGPPTTTGP
ncbi:DUF6473 family protein [Tranquillimonas alkanivorans]|uniref:DUF6473 domain-containing protein n=1 Tax=Tranquillimonas alkanivorans TaxID=441119 RepID=A0A1I5KBY9_9RHOB|nr:DUF6473 family protein [Tranquillimonas alkanivorans]SFO82545.1 hypothetical protein SAMN04488047_10115 [Tranquillimonas alkanivorans]